MPRCVVKNCPHWTGKKGSNVILHGFPNNIRLIKSWLLQTKQNFGDLDDFIQKVLEGKKNDLYRLCSSHFTNDCYEIRGTKRFLKYGALPTVFDDPSVEPQSKRTKSRNYRRDCETQTDNPTQVLTLISRKTPCTTVLKSRGTQVEPKYLTANCGIQCQLLIPNSEETVQDRTHPVQMEHFYPISL